MKKTTPIILILTLLSLIGFLSDSFGIGIYLSQEYPKLIPYLSFVTKLFVIVLVLLTLFTFIYLVSFLFSIKSTQLWERNSPWRKRYQNFVCDAMLADDVEKVYPLYTLSGNNAANIEQAKRIYGHTRKGWHKITDVRSGEIVGYFVLLHLNKNGVAAIENRRFNIASEDVLQCFAKRRTTCNSLYIGYIAGANKNAKAFALDRAKHFANKGKHQAFYARPTTDDGLRLVRSQNFKKVFATDRFEKNVFFVKKIATS